MEQAKIDISAVMTYLVTYASIGLAATWGMYISAILIVFSLLGWIAFNPLLGFVLVPLACLFKGIKELRR